MIKPNINQAMRIAYMLLGIGLLITPFVVTLPIATAILLPVCGLASIASGSTGF